MNRIERKEAIGIAELVKLVFKSNGMAAGHNSRLIFQAWDEASGASRNTIRKFYRAGKLYITLNSSVVCSQLSIQKEALLLKINSLIADNPLFIHDGDKTATVVKEIILK